MKSHGVSKPRNMRVIMAVCFFSEQVVVRSDSCGEVVSSLWWLWRTESPCGVSA